MICRSLMARETRPVRRDGHNLPPIRSTLHRLVSVIQYALILSLSLFSMACVSTRIEYFTDQSYRPREKSIPVEWLLVEPEQPYTEVARISVSSANYGSETLRDTILERARALGADAVVEEGEVVVHSMMPSPYYEPLLLGPKGAAFGLYGYGWFTPYSSNPFLLTQGAVDQPRLDKHLSGVAIRYQEPPAANEPR